MDLSIAATEAAVCFCCDEPGIAYPARSGHCQVSVNRPMSSCRLPARREVYASSAGVSEPTTPTSARRSDPAGRRAGSGVTEDDHQAARVAAAKVRASSGPGRVAHGRIKTVAYGLFGSFTATQGKRDELADYLAGQQTRCRPTPSACCTS